MATETRSGNKQGAEVEELAKQIATLREDMRKLLDTVGTVARSQADGAVARGRERVAETAEAGREMAHRAMEQAEHARDDLSRQIARNPLASAGIALGVGYILGLLSRRS